MVGGLTHNHPRTKIACGLYYFCVKEILGSDGSLTERLQRGLNQGFAFYENEGADPKELKHYDRIRDLKKLAQIDRKDILSGGYVIETIEAVMWSLANSGDYRETVLCAVNLSHDTDTVAAISGGLAGLFYGYDDIPKAWIEKIQRREWIESLCE